MGLLVPPPRDTSYQANFTGRPTTTWGTVATAHATIHTKGTKVELVTATTYDTDFMAITVHNTAVSATATDQLVNIYTGGAGVETVLIANLLSGWAADVSSGAAEGKRYEFPLRVPRGTRITADVQALITVDTVSIMLELTNRGQQQWSGVGVETLGATTATSKGTNVTPGAAAEGTFTAIGTSGRVYRYIQPMMSGNTDVTLVVGSDALDIGTGSAAIAGLSDFQFINSSVEYNSNTHAGRYTQIASGTALQARLQHHAADIEVKNVCFYGVY